MHSKERFTSFQCFVWISPKGGAFSSNPFFNPNACIITPYGCAPTQPQGVMMLYLRSAFWFADRLQIRVQPTGPDHFLYGDTPACDASGSMYC